MQPIDTLPQERLSGVVGVFMDIDETLSTRGKIAPRAFEALWRLHDAGVKTVPVTGRPAGWCDHIARFWPVDAVVGENGGFYFWHDGSRLRQWFQYDAEQRREFRKRLGAVRERILAEVPGCAVASDQLYREYDLAVDFCEDVPALPREDVVRIRRIFEEEGAHAKISSIHVNGWFGDFDKLSTSRRCAQDLFGLDLDRHREAFAFCGDSPNDEPMFAFFPLAFAVANFRPFADLVDHRPAFIASRESGDGFVEIVDRILAARSAEKDWRP